MDAAEKVVSAMLNHNLDDTNDEYIWEKYAIISCKLMPIQAWTALLKGYAHGGMMAKADSLFSALCSYDSVNEIGSGSKKRKRAESKHDCKANIRTLNTLLRGCLWSATSINPDVNRSSSEHKKRKKVNKHTLRNEQVGGIATAERAWELFNKIIQKNKDSAYDSSSYEYYITLLCQSLQYEKAELRVKQMKNQFNLSNNMGDFDPSIVESLVVCLVALARAYALLGKIEDVERCTSEALKMIKILSTANEKGQQKKGSKIATGGKQGWKSYADTEESGRREQSNTLFRSHRLSELETEATALSQYSFHVDEKCLAKVMATRLLYFSGGGTTSLNVIAEINSTSTKTNPQSVQQILLQLYNSLWISFGLNAAAQLHNTQIQANTTLSYDMCTFLARKLLGKDNQIIATTGYIDFSQVFPPIKGKSTSSHDAPLHIELGSGSGDWATIQAESNPSDNYLTVELRADRVAQTFSKMVLHNTMNIKIQGKEKNEQHSSILPNLCCVGSECGSFLKERIHPKTIKTIFVNHPEPPTQTSTNDEEQAHMLNSETILAAAKCLLQNGEGRIVVVTDNLIYAKLIGHTMANVIDQAKLTSLKPNEVSDLRKIETSSNPNKYGAFVHIYEGKPSSSIGHYSPKANSGTSYFDRLWRTGAGKHADMKRRYIIAVRTIGGDNNSFTSSSKKNKKTTQSSRSTGTSNKPSKKKSAEKQQRRNERRLMKKQQQKQQQQS